MDYKTEEYIEYAKFFAENIQHINKEGENVYTSIRYRRFSKIWNEKLEQNTNEMIAFKKWCKHKEKNRETREKLRGEKSLEERGIIINYEKLYYLCRYIITINEGWYIALLKPSVSQTIERIKTIKEISFTNEDGSIVTTDLSDITKPIERILKNIKEDTSSYVVDDIVCAKECSNKEIFQANFVYYLSRFLKNYFLVAIRKNNTYISESEQQLVLDMLSYFGLAHEAGLTRMRFRQLYKFAENVVESFSYCVIERIEIPISFVKYEDWKNKKLSFITKPFKDGKKEENSNEDGYKKILGQLNVGDTILFTDKVKKKLLLIAESSQNR